MKIVSKLILFQIVPIVISFYGLIMVMPAYALTARMEFSNLINNIHSLSGQFVQTTYDNHGKAIQQSVGKVALLRPGHFRWEVVKPIPQLIIASQTGLWIYDEDLAQVTVRAVKQISSETPGLLLSHSGNHLEKNFAVTLLNKSTANKRWFLLIPKNPDNMFARIQMSFNKGMIEEMQLYDHLGHMTHIIFKAIQMNVKLPVSLFLFKPTNRLDVIDETKE